MSWLGRQWFLLGLVAVLVLGAVLPHAFEWLVEASALRSAVVALVLFAMALPLDTASVTRSMLRPWPALLASAVNMLLLPLAAALFAQLLDGDLRTGLVVMAAVPCTLASAAVWTRKAGGDGTIAVLVTTLTNVTCFLTTPLLLWWLTGSVLTQEHLAQLARLPWRLGLLVVLPMVLAQLLRQVPAVATWAHRKKSSLSALTQVGILLMALAGASVCGTQMRAGIQVSGADFLTMFCLALVLHLVVLTAGMQLAKLCRMPRPAQIAVGIAGSQKTLMVGLDIALFYYGGLAILPMITYHFIQLVADTLIAEQLVARAPEDKRA